ELVIGTHFGTQLPFAWSVPGKSVHAPAANPPSRTSLYVAHCARTSARGSQYAPSSGTPAYQGVQALCRRYSHFTWAGKRTRSARSVSRISSSLAGGASDSSRCGACPRIHPTTAPHASRIVATGMPSAADRQSSPAPAAKVSYELPETCVAAG